MSKKMLNKVQKYKIVADDLTYKILHDVMHANFRIKNLATTMAYDWEQYKFSYHKRYGKYPSNKEVFGKASLATDIDTVLREEGEFTFVGSAIRNDAIREAVKKFDTVKSEMLRGARTIASYRRDGAFPLRAQAIKNLGIIKSGMYEADFSLLSIEGRKKYDVKSGQRRVRLLGSRRASESNRIIERVIKGEDGYLLSDSSVSYDKRKKMFLLKYGV